MPHSKMFMARRAQFFSPPTPGDKAREHTVCQSASTKTTRILASNELVIGCYSMSAAGVLWCLYGNDHSGGGGRTTLGIIFAFDQQRWIRGHYAEEGLHASGMFERVQITDENLSSAVT